jgi:hypothetical protein
MRAKSWIRNFHGERAISGGYQPDGRLEVWVGPRRYLMTLLQWGSLPIFW